MVSTDMRPSGLTKVAVGREVAPLLASESLSDFQRSVYTALCQVPPGKVTTYRDLARSINCGSSQAVGQALKRNPFAPKVPCHRVVKNDRSIGGFGGTISGQKIDKKIQLLQSEGVLFEDSKIHPSCIYNFEF